MSKAKLQGQVAFARKTLANKGKVLVTKREDLSDQREGLHDQREDPKMTLVTKGKAAKGKAADRPPFF